MAQSAIFNFEEDDKTDLLNRQHLGPIPNGLYRGFDYNPASAGLNLSLYHSETGYKEVLVDLSITPFLGLVRTKQGVNLKEDEAVVIPVTGNSGGANPRIDLVVLEHEYVELAGGTIAGYSVIVGTPDANPVAPAKTAPEKQEELGRIYWPAGAADLGATGVKYTRARTPNFNGETGNDVQAAITYDAGSKSLISVVDSNQYILEAVTPTTYLEVDTITVPYTGFPSITNELNRVTIRTEQRLKFIAGGNIVLDGVDSIHVEVGEFVTFLDIKNTPFAVGGTSTYLLVTGNELRRDRYAKMFAQLVSNKGTAAVNALTGFITLDGKGNYYEISYDFAATILSGISTTDDLNGGFGNAGGIICLKMMNTGTPGAVGSFNELGYKAVINGTGAPLAIHHESLLFLYETENEYVLFSVAGAGLSYADLYKDYHALTQIEEKIYTKTQSTGWKDLGSGAFNTSNGVLSITDEGNSFVVSVPGTDIGGILKDIQIKRGVASPAVAPSGLIVTIKFIHAVYLPGVTEPFTITSLSSNISLPVDDSIRAGGAVGVLHLHVPPNEDSNIITFRKTATKWEIVAMSPQADDYARIKTLEANSYTLEAWTAVSLYTQGGGTVRYRKDSKGRVFLDREYTNSSTSTGGHNVTTLPVGYRPATEKSFPVVILGSPSSIGYCTISTGGGGYRYRTYSSVSGVRCTS